MSDVHALVSPWHRDTVSSAEFGSGWRLQAHRRHLTSFALKTHLTSGAFPPPELPGFSGTTTLSDFGADRCPSAATLVQNGSPPLARPPVSACRAHYPGGLAQVHFLPSPIFGGVGTTTSLSRPAQASHTLRPVDSLPRPRLGLSQGFDTVSYPIAPPASRRANRPLPGWDLHPHGDRALRGAPESDRSTERPEMEAPGGQISVCAGRQVDFPR
jgi:hypothetical protein